MTSPGMRSAAAMALFFCKRRFRDFWTASAKNRQESPQSPQARVARQPPQLLPQCAPTLLMLNETRSIVRGLLRHKARRRCRALWYLNMRFAAQPENDCAAIMRFMARPDDNKTLGTSRASTPGEAQRVTCAFHAKRYEERSYANTAAKRAS
jgi:hypothetical protein